MNKGINKKYHLRCENYSPKYYSFQTIYIIVEIILVTLHLFNQKAVISREPNMLVNIFNFCSH